MAEDKKVVLAVDDNPVQLKLYKEMLVPRYDLRVAKSASDALHFLNTNKSDIILLDIEMPNISGFEFLADIRQILSYTKVPIIIVSGNKGQEFYQKARASSASDVLTKPVTEESLVSSIQKALGEKR